MDLPSRRTLAKNVIYLIEKLGSLGWGRTSDISINSRTLYR
jgi:hypothetical protein